MTTELSLLSVAGLVAVIVPFYTYRYWRRKGWL